VQYYIGYEVEVEIEVNNKRENNNGYWYGYGFEDVIEHATILLIQLKIKHFWNLFSIGTIAKIYKIKKETIKV